MTKASSVHANAVVALVLEVGDRTDVWGPHGSEMSCGTQLSEKEREEHIRGREDISSEPADWTPACGAGVACHISKYGKNITQTSLHWYSCRSHFKINNLMSDIRCNGKNIKTPSPSGSRLAGSVGPVWEVGYCVFGPTERVKDWEAFVLGYLIFELYTTSVFVY